MPQRSQTSLHFAGEIANKPRNAAHNGSFLYITIVFSIVCLTLMNSILWSVLGIAITAFVMRMLLYFGHHQHIPNNRTINGLAIVSGGVLVYQSQYLDLISTMINLLMLASSLKIMILNTQKDLQALFLALVFLTALGFIHNTNMLFVGLYTVIILVLLMTLALHFAPSQSHQTTAHRMFKLTLQAIPICAILFILIPPFPPFWEMPRPHSTSTGLTDVVKPGDIANLAQSSELSFSVQFTEPETVPKSHERYWRALTLDVFDGEQWTTSNITLMPDIRPTMKYEPLSPKSSYQVFLQPNDTRYLPVLAYPERISSTEPSTYLTETATAATLSPSANAIEYQVTSILGNIKKEPLSFAETYLQIPSNNSNPMTRAWVAQFDFESIHEWVVWFNHYLLDNGFDYTLSPPLMPNNNIDAFLFDYQKGFCSHYASALAYVLRLAGYPTRLVVGYQGGEMISETHMLIHQFDAHAWLEVYDAQQGWIRLDPTAVIAPTRIRQNLIEQLKTQNESTDWAGLRNYLQTEWQKQLFQSMQLWQISWQQNLLAFDKKDHHQLIQRIKNMLSNQYPTLLTAVVLLLCGIGIYSYLKRRAQAVKNPYLEIYLRAKAKCIHMTKPHSDTHVKTMPPKQFQQWLYEKDTDLAILLHPITDGIEKHLYAQMEVDLQEMKQAFKQINKYRI
jgi:transglutaminase-like putative cysteine protease